MNWETLNRIDFFCVCFIRCSSYGATIPWITYCFGWDGVCVMLLMPTATLCACTDGCMVGRCAVEFSLFFSFTRTLLRRSPIIVVVVVCWCYRCGSWYTPYRRRTNTMHTTLTICLPLMPFNLFPEAAEEEKMTLFVRVSVSVPAIRRKVLNSAQIRNGCSAFTTRRGQIE